MDLATLIGLIGAFGVIVGAIVSGGDVALFVNPPSLLIVIGAEVMRIVPYTSPGTGAQTSSA